MLTIMAVDYQTLIDLIDDARKARAEVDVELADTERRVSELRQRQQVLREEEDMYTLTLTRRFPGEQAGLAAVTPESFDSGFDMPIQLDWLAMPRTDAVELAIQEITSNVMVDAASPGDIENFLRNRGRDDSREAIGGAIAHLNRTSRIQSVGRAQWALADSIDLREDV